MSHNSSTPSQPECGGTAWGGYAGFEDLYKAYRAELIAWDGTRRDQERHYRPCGNGCLLPGKWRTLDDRELCGPCYAEIAADEQRKVFGR